jgi:hypothetical protein
MLPSPGVYRPLRLCKPDGFYDEWESGMEYGWKMIVTSSVGSLAAGLASYHLFTLRRKGFQ